MVDRIRIEINTTKAQLNITNKIRKFSVERTPSEMEINKEMPKFDIDMAKYYAECGLKNPKYLMNDTRQKAYNKVMSNIRRIVQEGDMMMNITNSAPDEMVPVIARENMRAAIPELVMVPMPKSMLDITWTKGSTDVSFTKASMELVWDSDYAPELSVSPYAVEVSIRNFKPIGVNELSGQFLGVDRKV